LEAAAASTPAGRPRTRRAREFRQCAPHPSPDCTRPELALRQGKQWACAAERWQLRRARPCVTTDIGSQRGLHGAAVHTRAIAATARRGGRRRRRPLHHLMYRGFVDGRRAACGKAHVHKQEHERGSTAWDLRAVCNVVAGKSMRRRRPTRSSQEASSSMRGAGGAQIGLREPGSTKVATGT